MTQLLLDRGANAASCCTTGDMTGQYSDHHLQQMITEQDSPEETVTRGWWKNPTHLPFGSLLILIFPGRNRRSGLLLAVVNLCAIKI